jgi:hypothetical protein
MSLTFMGSSLRSSQHAPAFGFRFQHFSFSSHIQADTLKACEAGVLKG